MRSNTRWRERRSRERRKGFERRRREDMAAAKAIRRNKPTPQSSSPRSADSSPSQGEPGIMAASPSQGSREWRLPPLVKGRWRERRSRERRKGPIMQAMPPKSNKELVPLARTLRKNMTRQERKLWYDYLSHCPIRFYRQKILGHCIVDFYCAAARLAVEIDGSQHYKPDERAKDEERTRFLEGYGITVLRISNYEVDTNFEGVCLWILRHAQALIAQREGRREGDPKE